MSLWAKHTAPKETPQQKLENALHLEELTPEQQAAFRARLYAPPAQRKPTT